MKNVFPSPHPLVAHKLALLRSKDTDPKNFRELVREIAALLTYEATADLMTKPISVETPLETAPGIELQENIGLVPILRSGLGMVEGVWELMPSAPGSSPTSTHSICTVMSARLNLWNTITNYPLHLPSRSP